MDGHLRAEGPGVRLSNSPRRSPQITQAVTSPVRSVHPEMQGMESIHSQPDFGLRTTDFFDESSEDESANPVEATGDAPDVDLLERRGSATKKRNSRQRPPTSDPIASQCESKRGPVHPEAGGYQRLSALQGESLRLAETPGTSFHGSVDELLPEEDRAGAPGYPGAAYIPTGRTPRASSHLERQEDWQTPLPPNKPDQLLGAYAIAHEITLQALMRDEDALDRSLQTFAPLGSEHRASLLPASLRLHDPRSPRNATFSSPQSASSKKVQVVPPPIDTSGPRRSIPADIVRTPYPFSPENVRRKDLGRSPQSGTATPRMPAMAESVLTLSIRRMNPNSMRKVTILTIPASNDFTAVRSNSIGEKERHFKALDFDDAEFFRQLRRCYRELSGPICFFGARSLTRIAVSGPASKAADAGYGWLHQPRSPRVLAYRGLTDTFSEEKILQHYRKPALGRSRYAFVHWAHRLAAAPPARTPQGEDDIEATIERDLIRRMEQPEGLEFVVSWSVLRILAALLLVFAVGIAGALLWIFLGRNTVAGHSHGGFRDAGDRVGAGVLIGICTVLVGLSGIAGWLGVSWLVM